MASNRMRKIVAACLAVAALVVCCLNINWYESNSAAEQAASGDETLSNNKIGYGVVVDCGSSGSRVYVHSWKAEYIEGQLLNISTKALFKNRAGLSSFESKNDSELVSYVRELADVAANFVPANQHKETPFYMLCTAGMRKLTSEAMDRILGIARNVIKSNYKFEFHDHHARVISGKEEAVYMWLTTNYLSKRLGETNSSTDGVCFKGRCRHLTSGMMEMGGASMQIAFEVDPNDGTKFLRADALSREHLVEVNLSCSANSPLHYVIYATSYLNYGADVARDIYNDALIKRAKTGHNQNARISVDSDRRVIDPCFALGDNDTVKENRKVHSSANWTLTGASNFEECLRRINETVMNISCSPCIASGSSKNDLCNLTQRCTIKALWQPIIPYDKLNFYGFAQFYYRYGEFYNVSEVYNASFFRENIKRTCEMDHKTLTETYSWFLTAKSTFRNQLRRHCFTSTYIYLVLHDAFNFPPAYNKLKIVRNIKGEMPEWPIGAILYKSRKIQARYKSRVKIPLISAQKDNGCDSIRSNNVLVWLTLTTAVLMIRR